MTYLTKWSYTSYQWLIMSGSSYAAHHCRIPMSSRSLHTAISGFLCAAHRRLASRGPSAALLLRPSIEFFHGPSSSALLHHVGYHSLRCFTVPISGLFDAAYQWLLARPMAFSRGPSAACLTQAIYGFLHDQSVVSLRPAC